MINITEAWQSAAGEAAATLMPTTPIIIAVIKTAVFVAIILDRVVKIILY